MDLFFVDDAGQKKPSRPGIGPLLAVGGIYVPDESVRETERLIESLCAEYGFPPKEIFKWSPGKELWMYHNLVDEKRQEFLMRVLNVAKDGDVKVIVVIEDTNYDTATKTTKRDIDLITLFLERAHWELTARRCCGMVIVSQPSGDRRVENKFIADCVQTLKLGTDYVNLEWIALSILSSPSRFIRLLQVADIVTSCATAYVGGESNFSPPIFEIIKSMLVRDSRRIGGIGLKIHPDIVYANLYHWLLGDSLFIKGNIGLGMPLPNAPYSKGPNNP